MMKDPLITMEEVNRHTSKNDCWIIIHGKVYDVTSFLHKHPGGAQVLLKYAGKDSTLPFDDIGHSMESLAYDLDPGALKGTLYVPHSKSSYGEGDSEHNFWFPFHPSTFCLPSRLHWISEFCHTVKEASNLEKDNRIWMFSGIIILCVLSLGLIRWGQDYNIVDDTDYGLPSWMD